MASGGREEGTNTVVKPSGKARRLHASSRKGVYLSEFGEWRGRGGRVCGGEEWVLRCRTKEKSDGRKRATEEPSRGPKETEVARRARGARA